MNKQKGVVDFAMMIGLAVFVVLWIGGHERNKQEEQHTEEMIELQNQIIEMELEE